MADIHTYGYHIDVASVERLAQASRRRRQYHAYYLPATGRVVYDEDPEAPIQGMLPGEAVSLGICRHAATPQQVVRRILKQIAPTKFGPGARQYTEIYNSAPRYSDPAAYVNEWRSSHLSPDVLHTLWHVANDPFRDFLALLGLTMMECSNRFGIPYRTIQNWSDGNRNPPLYLRRMMAELAGLPGV